MQRLSQRKPARGIYSCLHRAEIVVTHPEQMTSIVARMGLEIVQIIEDEPLHASLLDRSLRRARYRTNVAADGATGLADVKRLRPHVVLLDLLLPGLDGYEVCRLIRQTSATSNTAIIILSALSEEEEVQKGLRMGADRYLVKPFSPREVVATVASLLHSRRLTPRLHSDQSILRIEDHCLVVSLHGKQLTVSQEEWQLLHHVSARPGQVVTVEELIGLLWNDTDPIRDRQLEMLMRTLRTKVKNNGGGSIEILSCLGYRYLPPASSSRVGLMSGAH